MSINSVASNFILSSNSNTTANKNSEDASFQSVMSVVSSQLTSGLAKLGALSNIETIPASATTSISVSANLNASESVYTGTYDAGNSSENMASGAVNPNFTRPVTVYDSKGTPHNLTLSFLKTGKNDWAVEVISQPPSDVTGPDGQVASGTVTFNSNGTVASVSSSLKSLKVDWTDGAAPSKIALNLGSSGSAAGLSQFNSSYVVKAVSQNGTPAGDLTGFNIRNGQIFANYSNGVSKAIL